MQKAASNWRHIIKKDCHNSTRREGRNFETTIIVFPKEQLIIFCTFKIQQIEQMIANISLSGGPIEKEQIALNTYHIDHFFH